jgi:hypothetical protein
LAEALAGMPRLRNLDLSWRRFTESLANFGKGMVFAALENLNLGGSFATLSGKFLASESFPKLRSLDLSHNNLEGGLAALCDSPFTKTLRKLNIQHCATSANDIKVFAQTARMPELESLSVGDDALMTVKAISVLGAAEGFPGLRSLHLKIPGSAKVYQALADSPLIRQVKSLTIYGGTVSARCTDILIGSPGFQGLSALQFWGSSGVNSRRLRDHFGERFLG